MSNYEYLHCQGCKAWSLPENNNLLLLECTHLSCQNCLVKANGTCPSCNSQSSSSLNLFTDTDNPIVESMLKPVINQVKDMMQVWEIQTARNTELLAFVKGTSAHYQAKCNDLQANLAQLTQQNRHLTEALRARGGGGLPGSVGAAVGPGGQIQTVMGGENGNGLTRSRSFVFKTNQPMDPTSGNQVGRNSHPPPSPSPSHQQPLHPNLQPLRNRPSSSASNISSRGGDPARFLVQRTASAMGGDFVNSTTPSQMQQQQQRQHQQQQQLRQRQPLHQQVRLGQPLPRSQGRTSTAPTGRNNQVIPRDSFSSRPYPNTSTFVAARPLQQQQQQQRSKNTFSY